MRTPGPAADMTGWTTAAACATLESTFMDRTTAGMRHAKQVCLSCTVAEACLWVAMAEELETERYGRWLVRGGLLPGQREELRAMVSPPQIARFAVDTARTWKLFPTPPGDLPRREPVQVCACGTPIAREAGTPGPMRKWCSARCRERARPLRRRSRLKAA